MCKRERERAGEIEINIKCILLYIGEKCHPKGSSAAARSTTPTPKGRILLCLKTMVKKIRKKATEALIENSVLFQHSTYICNICASYAQENFCKKKKITIREYLNDFLEAIDSGMFSEENLDKIAGSIGRFFWQDRLQKMPHPVVMITKTQALSNNSVLMVRCSIET